jgi:long-subunit acyl-CoA synthetase (AMP-forming)
MALTLRDLLIQRAARLQERPALTAPEWGTLSYAQLRNRIEGVALGLLAGPGDPPPSVFAATGSPWDWAAEVAAAASGLIWDPAGSRVPSEVLGGARFNAEEGRGPFHHREQVVMETTPFHAGLSHAEVLRRLTRLNHRLGWDHETSVMFPLAHLEEPAVRAGLWSALYGGSHAVLQAPADPARPKRLLTLFRRVPGPAWDPSPFEGFWD